MAYSHGPAPQYKQEKQSVFVVKESKKADVNIDKYFGLNDCLVVDLVHPAAAYRLFDEYASTLADEVMQVANAPPEEITRYKFGYSKRN